MASRNQTLPHRTYPDPSTATDDLPSQGRIRGTLSALLAAGAGAAAVRTLVKQVAKRSLGPVGLLITVGEALLALRAATRAISRWRADRRLRRARTRRGPAAPPRGPRPHRTPAGTRRRP